MNIQDKNYIRLLSFVQTKEFSKCWDSLGFTDDDLIKLEQMISHNPKRYPVIPGTGGLRKMRFAFEGHGKSGGVRVCYVNFLAYKIIYLITVYAKSDQDNLSKDERNCIKKTISFLEKEVEREN